MEGFKLFRLRPFAEVSIESVEKNVQKKLRHLFGALQVQRVDSAEFRAESAAGDRGFTARRSTI